MDILLDYDSSMEPVLSILVANCGLSVAEIEFLVDFGNVNIVEMGLYEAIRKESIGVTTGSLSKYLEKSGIQVEIAQIGPSIDPVFSGILEILATRKVSELESLPSEKV